MSAYSAPSAVFDARFQTEIRSFFHAGRTFRFPALLLDRYEITSILAAGGFGLILTALDHRVCDRPVLVKTPLLPPGHFRAPRNVALNRYLDDCRRRHGTEFKMLLHCHHRGMRGVPVYLDRCLAPNPNLYGPHRADDGSSFVIDDPENYLKFPYLILGYLDGHPLSSSMLQWKNWWPLHRRLRECRSVGLRVSSLLGVLHEELDYYRW